MAVTIGLRAKAMAIAVPRRSALVPTAATARGSSGSTWVSATQRPWNPFASSVLAYSPASSIASVVVNASSFIALQPEVRPADLLHAAHLARRAFDRDPPAL